MFNSIAKAFFEMKDGDSAIKLFKVQRQIGVPFTGFFVFRLFKLLHELGRHEGILEKVTQDKSCYCNIREKTN
jgi:hypothetical protein